MTRDEIDVMWQRALHDSVRDGEQFTRYYFSQLVAAATRKATLEEMIYAHPTTAIEKAVAYEREACAKVCEELQAPPYVSMSDASMWDVATMECSEAIRARGQQ